MKDRFARECISDIDELLARLHDRVSTTEVNLAVIYGRIEAVESEQGDLERGLAEERMYRLLVEEPVWQAEPETQEPDLEAEQFLHSAIAGEQPILFRYTKPGQNDWESRVISPYEVQDVTNGTIVLGWDHRREDIRSFRLDRMDALTVASCEYRQPVD